MTAQEFQRLKTTVPSEMRTAQWSRVPLWQRERAFFMAGVTNTVLLDAFRESAQAIVEGRESEDQALRRIREALGKEGYKPGPGQEGTIKDLSTVRRQLTTLRANVQLARGWASLEAQKGDIAHPATELFRAAGRKKERLWQLLLWPNAVDRRNAQEPAKPALRKDVMVAPAGDAVWAMLSDFGAPYDPLKYNTGMRQRPVGFRKARELGIVAGPIGPIGPIGPMGEGSKVMESPGAVLETSLPGKTPVFKAGLERSLKGLGEWREDTLVFTDPNGTRPYTPEALAPIISRPNVDGTANYQLRALQEWMALGGNEAAVEAMRQKFAGMDTLDDFNRLLLRLQRARRGVAAAELLTSLATGLLGLFAL